MINFENGKKYKYEHMDLVALMVLVNTIVIIIWNKGAYIGLPVAIYNLIYDYKHGCHINNVIMQISLIIMNIYFLIL